MSMPILWPFYCMLRWQLAATAALARPRIAHAGAPGDIFDPSLRGWTLFLCFHLAMVAICLLYLVYFGERIRQARDVVIAGRRRAFWVGAGFLMLIAAAGQFAQRTLAPAQPDLHRLVVMALLLCWIWIYARGLAAIALDLGERILVRAGSSQTDNEPLALTLGGIVIGLAASFPLAGWILGIYAICLACGASLLSRRRLT